MKTILYLSLILNVRQSVSQNINVTVSDYPAQSVKMGWYPEMAVWNVSLPNCGLRYKPERFKVVFNRKCFHRKYWDRDVVDYEGIRFSSGGENGIIYNRVLFGFRTNYYEAPYVIYISIKNWVGLPYSFCTGVLVSPQWVLTAAHCWKDLSTVVNAGGNYWSGIEQMDVLKAVVHPDYNDGKNRDHDIALLKLKYPFTKERTDGRHFAINSICLPEEGMAKKTTTLEKATFYGYGGTGDDPRPNMMLRGELNLEWCHTGTQLCSRAPPDTNVSRACGGDSGSPVMQFTDKYRTRAFLRGITHSHGPMDRGCTEWISGSNMVDVSDHIKWIFNTIKNN